MLAIKSTPISNRHLKHKFKQLIQTLRKRTTFKQTSPSPNSLPIQSHEELQIHDENILPVTQINNEHLHLFSNEECSRSENSSEIIKNHMKAIGNINDIEESIKEEENQAVQEAQGTDLLVNELTDLLRPGEKLKLLKNEGRTGCIRRQKFSVNKASKAIKEPRYAKIPRINQQPPLDPPKVDDLPNVIRRISIKELDDIEMIKYWNTSKKITQNSTVEQIYSLFSQLIDELNINMNQPTIKKYKNCVYFGNKPQSSDHIYEGLIYYYENKMYYGELCYGNKHGHGVEINFEKNTKYAGSFKHGKKSGYFFVQKERENYEGMLEHGIYQGQGKLMTEDYVYIGTFQNGKKHGFGQEHYPKTGLRLKGCFQNGEYQTLNNNKSKLLPDPTSEQQLRIKPEKMLSKNNSYDIDFQLQNSFKRQIQGLSQPIQREQLPRQDSQSLFDMLTNSSKLNKYDYNVQSTISKLPKIRIEGIHTMFKEHNPELVQQIFPKNRQYELFNSRQESTIKRRYHSHHQKAAIQSNSIDIEPPLSKHKISFPIRGHQ